MKGLTISISLMAFCMATAFVSGNETFQDLNSGKSFPRTITVDFEGNKHQLKATGATTRKKFIVSVYSIASYIENPNPDAGIEQMLDPTKTKQLTQIYMQNIEKHKFAAVMNESLAQNIPSDQMASLKPVVNEFLGFYNPITANDVHEIRWYPGGTVELRINGSKVGTIKNEAFAIALWKIWFGDKSVVNRKEMVSLL